VNKKSMEPGTWTPLPHADADLERARSAPDTPQTRSATYRLAWSDEDFMTRRELRAVRLQLELLKPEMTLAERGIRSTVILFGGARLPEPGGEAWAAKNEVQKKNLLKNSVYYDEARKFARLCSQHSAQYYYREFVVVTGGGPGVMEAGNRGADEVGAPSIGLNIVLPHEQAGNAFQDVGINFRYFFARKMMFVRFASAYVVLPGGFGTVDELTECLTLVQTGKTRKIPIILVGGDFWKGLIDWMRDKLVGEGLISPGDMDLMTLIDEPEAIVDAIFDYYESRGFQPTRAERDRMLNL